MEKEMFIEMMAHIWTIENVLMARYNISDEIMNEQIKANKESIREQLK
jgi:hypothetical protein